MSGLSHKMSEISSDLEKEQVRAVPKIQRWLDVVP